MNSVPRWCAVVLAGVATLSGCGGPSDRPAVYKVTGVVKIGSAPVPDANVTFFPEAGRPASGKTNANGEFSLTTFNTDDGAVEGLHNVSIVSVMAEEIESNTPDDLKKLEKAVKNVPVKYGDAKTSGLKNTVSSKETNHFEITLDPK